MITYEAPGIAKICGSVHATRPLSTPELSPRGKVLGFWDRHHDEREEGLQGPWAVPLDTSELSVKVQRVSQHWASWLVPEDRSSEGGRRLIGVIQKYCNEVQMDASCPQLVETRVSLFITIHMYERTHVYQKINYLYQYSFILLSILAYQENVSKEQPPSAYMTSRH